MFSELFLTFSLPLADGVLSSRNGLLDLDLVDEFFFFNFKNWFSSGTFESLTSLKKMSISCMTPLSLISVRTNVACWM